METQAIGSRLLRVQNGCLCNIYSMLQVSCLIAAIQSVHNMCGSLREPQMFKTGWSIQANIVSKYNFTQIVFWNICGHMLLSLHIIGCLFMVMPAPPTSQFSWLSDPVLTANASSGSSDMPAAPSEIPHPHATL
jgi:hypothetical protein